MTPSDLLAGAFLVLAVVLIVGVVGLYFFAVALALLERLEERDYRLVRARPHRVRFDVRKCPAHNHIPFHRRIRITSTGSPAWEWWGR